MSGEEATEERAGLHKDNRFTDLLCPLGNLRPGFTGWKCVRLVVRA